MERRKIAAGNWKMNTNLQEGLDLTRHILAGDIPSDVEVILGVPFTHIWAVKQALKDARIKVAAQNCHEESSGAYTGEISASMLKSINSDAVILGHSERRQLFGETDEQVAQKIDRALEAELQVIYCCGEVLQDRDENLQDQVVSAQIEAALFHLTGDQLKSIIIAYEPVWAIGTGRTATPEQAQSMHAFIRRRLAMQYGEKIASNISILYGGSVKPTNAKEIFTGADVDGGLIGGASLKGGDFLEIIRSF